MGKPHALVLPMPAQGHINPMLNFAKQLAIRGVVITFLNTQQTQRRMTQNAHQLAIDSAFDFRFATIPDGSEEPLLGTSDDSFQLSSVWAVLRGIESQQGFIEDMVVSSRASPCPITCIIMDSFFPWASKLAFKLGIQRVMFWTSNGNTLAIGMQLKSGNLSVTDGGANTLVVGNDSIMGSDLVESFRLDPERLQKLVERLDDVEQVTCIIVNTLQELEGSTLEASASCGTKVHCVGPIMPPLDHDTKHINVSFYKEEQECIQWLDKQAPRSVLYISFGSIATLSPQELQELAFGVEESKQAFLWVWRDNKELFPCGFLDRMCDRGLVVKWSPQLEVLGHVAVGAFLTHCGWNSILESIHMGVPMLCYPRILDQHLNALLITNVWKLGIPLLKEKDKLTREEVQRGIQTVLHSTELQENSLMWKNVVRHALEQGGSSYQALEEFLEQLNV